MLSEYSVPNQERLVALPLRFSRKSNFTLFIRTHLAKPHPLFPAISVDGKLVVAVQMADIEGFSAPCCMAAEDTE